MKTYSDGSHYLGLRHFAESHLTDDQLREREREREKEKETDTVRREGGREKERKGFKLAMSSTMTNPSNATYKLGWQG